MLIGGGGGWGSITGNTYQIKTMAVAPGSTSGFTASEIEALFSYLDPGAVADAGKAHTAAAQTLTAIADSLVTHAQVLSGAWSGTAAQASINSFQQLHQTATNLAQASAKTGAVLSWLGTTILPYYKSWKAPSNGIVGSIESFFGTNPQDAAAQAVMQRLNDRLTQGNAGLPPSVTQNLPHVGAAGHSSATTGGIPPGGGAGAAAGGVGLAGGARGGISLARGGGGVRGIAPGGAGPGAGVPGGGGGGLGGVTPGPSPSAPTHLAGLPPGGGPGPGVSPGSGGVPGGGVPGGGGIPGGGAPPGGTVGPGGPNPVGVPVPGGGVPGGGGGAGVPGGPGGLGTVPGEGTGPGGVGTIGGGTGVGAAGGEPGVGGVGGSGAGGQGLIGENVVGATQGESAVIGSDGMIGVGPEGLGAAGVGESGFGIGNTGATGFVGADDAAVNGAAGAGESGFPMGGGPGGGRQEGERHRQAWMAEDLDVWEGKPEEVAPPLISA
jgi:uncharacterized protein YukE